MSVRGSRTGPKGRRRVIAAVGVSTVAAGVLVGVNTMSAQSFPPTKGVGRLAGLSSSHGSMTEDAFDQLAEEYFDVTSLPQSMKKARKQIMDANADMDLNERKTGVPIPENHFDDETFLVANARLIRLAGSVQTELADGNVAAARKSLGNGLHALQDFYSHSNWVELGNTGINTGLGRDDGDIGPLAGPGEETCEADGGTLKGRAAPGPGAHVLTSGYYLHPQPGKCRHGGAYDTGSDEGINKDTDLDRYSPHDEFHPQAASLAEQASVEWIREVVAKDLDDEQRAALFGYGPALGFAIDTTGSMGGIINAVQAEAIDGGRPDRHQGRAAPVCAVPVQRPLQRAADQDRPGAAVQVGDRGALRLRRR